MPTPIESSTSESSHQPESTSQHPNVTKILPEDEKSMRLSFDNGDSFVISFLDLRFECPCATCVNEITGKRMLKREHLKPEVRPKQVEPVGRYGIKVKWSDGHSTGMYHYESLYKIAVKYGSR